MGRSVVGGDPEPAFPVDPEGECPFAVFGDALGDVDGKVILLDGIQYPYLFPASGDDGSGISYLSTHLGIERSLVEYELEHRLVLLFDGALLQEPDTFQFEAVISEECFLFTIVIYRPVAEFVGRGVPGSVLLLLEFHVEAFHVDGIAVFGGDEARKVDGKSVGVVKDEGIGAWDTLGPGVPGHIVIHHLDAAVEGPEERQFLFPDHALYQFLLLSEFRICFTHVFH